MKHFFFLLTLHTLILTAAISQNMDRDEVEIKYVMVPLNSFPDSTETYYVSAKPSATSNSNTLGSVYDAEKVVLNGYYKVPSADDADIVVETNLVNELFYKGTKLYQTEYTYRKDKNSPEVKYIANTYNISYITPKLHYSIKTGGGKVLQEGFVGAKEEIAGFGNSNYKDHYSTESQVSAAWADAKKYKLSEWEKYHFDEAFKSIPAICNSYCLLQASNSFNVRYVKEKKTNDYEDLRQAKIFFTEGVNYIATDHITLINKLIQPDYNKRIETIKKAITIWEKALEESNLENKKARIDQKVTRHIYYNLSLAYTLINNFDKARQYLQGREDEETNKVLLKNTFAGIESLSSFNDFQKKRYEANKWRPLLTSDDNVYVYKDPATRKKEYQDSLLAEKERIDLINKKNTTGIANTKKRKGSKSASITKKTSSASITLESKKLDKTLVTEAKNTPGKTETLQHTINADTIINSDTATAAAKKYNFDNLYAIDSLIIGKPWQIADYKTKNNSVPFFKKNSVYIFLKDKKLNVYSLPNKNNLQTSKLESKGSWSTFTQRGSIQSLKIAATSNSGESLNGVGVLTQVSDTAFKLETYNEQVTFYLLKEVPQYGDLALIKDQIKIPGAKVPVDFSPKLQVTDKPTTIYIYRPKALFGIGKNTNYALYINETPIGIMKDGDRIEYKLYSEGTANIAISITEGTNIGDVVNNLSAVQNSGLAATSIGAAGLGYTAVQGVSAGMKAFSNKNETLTINNGETIFFKIDSKLGSFKKVQNLQDGQKDFEDSKKSFGTINRLKEDIYNPVPQMSLYKEIERQKSELVNQ